MANLEAALKQIEQIQGMVSKQPVYCDDLWDVLRAYHGEQGPLPQPKFAPGQQAWHPRGGYAGRIEGRVYECGGSGWGWHYDLNGHYRVPESSLMDHAPQSEKPKPPKFGVGDKARIIRHPDYGHTVRVLQRSIWTYLVAPLDDWPFSDGTWMAWHNADDLQAIE